MTLTAHLQIPDDEFAQVIGSAKIESAVVTSNEVMRSGLRIIRGMTANNSETASSERELLNR